MLGVEDRLLVDGQVDLAGYRGLVPAHGPGVYLGPAYLGADEGLGVQAGGDRRQADYPAVVLEQKQLFTEEEIRNLYIECGYLGDFVKKCQDMGITEELTWVINGQIYPGLKTETELRTLVNC